MVVTQLRRRRLVGWLVILGCTSQGATRATGERRAAFVPGLLRRGSFSPLSPAIRSTPPTAPLRAVMTPTVDPGPLAATAVCAASFLWLRATVASYNAAADEFDAARERLRAARVRQLAGEEASGVAEASAAVDDALRRMDDARTVRVGPIVARVRVPDRSGETRADAEPPQTAPAPAVRVALMGAIVALLVPLFVLTTLADPMRPPSPALDAAFRAMDGAPPGELGGSSVPGLEKFPRLR